MDCNLKQISCACTFNTVYISRKNDLKQRNRVYAKITFFLWLNQNAFLDGCIKPCPVLGPA